MLLLFLLSAVALAAPVPRGIDTRNDLAGPCKDVTLIFARGTTETGNVGLVAGPPLFGALGYMIGNDKLAVQGVDYPADIAGYLVGGSISGASTLASLVNQAKSKCPSTKIVLGGYSQGAQVVYLGAAQLGDTSHIKAVVLFGNPNNGKPVPNIPSDECKTFCKEGDLICDGKPIVLPVHLTYGTDAQAAAQFITSHL